MCATFLPMKSFKEYDIFAKEAEFFNPPDPILYNAIGLSGEAGEILNKLKKVMRDSSGAYTSDVKKELAKELCDCLFYLSRAADSVGFSLEGIAKLSEEKINSRRNRGTLSGSGDNR